MNRFFAIYHGLTPAAPWGVAVEREFGSPKVELLMLCRTEKEAVQFANLTSLGHGLKKYRDEKVASGEGQSVGAKR
ncbi:MAG TPA: hypothetical protein VFV96_15140 [Verrucomicrobiae bacterium]|nr:hypothetical protein [Verrucomicrobiae bacterium]